MRKIELIVSLILHIYNVMNLAKDVLSNDFFFKEKKDVLFFCNAKWDK